MRTTISLRVEREWPSVTPGRLWPTTNSKEAKTASPEGGDETQRQSSVCQMPESSLPGSIGSDKELEPGLEPLGQV